MKKPIRIFYSTLSNRFFASARYRELDSGIVVITGEKYDVTNQIAALIQEHQVEFSPAPPSSNGDADVA